MTDHTTGNAGGAEEQAPPNDICPSCGIAYKQSFRYCPHCGAAADSEDMPTPIDYDLSEPMGPDRLLTGYKVWDLLLGWLLGTLIMALPVVGWFTAPMEYYHRRPEYPTFAKGIGIAILLMTSVYLCLLIACVVAIYQAFLLD